MEVGMTNEGIVIRLNSDGSRLAVGLNNNTTIWECETGRKVAEFEGPLDSFSPDGKFAAVSNRIVAVDSGHEFFSAAMARGEARFSPDGQMVAFTTESNSSAGAFFTTNGQPVMPGIPTRIVGTTPFVQFSPEGRRLIHSGSAGEVGVWDLVQQRQSLPTLAHGISVWDDGMFDRRKASWQRERAVAGRICGICSTASRPANPANRLTPFGGFVWPRMRPGWRHGVWQRIRQILTFVGARRNGRTFERDVPFRWS